LPSERHRHPLRQESCEGKFETAWQMIEDPSIDMSRIAELPGDADARAVRQAVRRRDCTVPAIQPGERGDGTPRSTQAKKWRRVTAPEIPKEDSAAAKPRC
jgi:hypothetical protein